MLIKDQARAYYPSPPYADFPRSEFQDRIARAREGMALAEIDLLVLWDRKNIRYFTGFESIHWSAMSIQPAVCLLPLGEEPILIVPQFFRGVAEGLTHLSRIWCQRDPHLVEAVRDLPREVAGAIKDLGLDRGRIGLESGREGGMAVPRPINDIDLLRSELDGAQFKDGSSAIWRCRTIKSASEVEAVSRASEAVVIALGELVANFRLGMTEREVGILIQKSLIEHAHEIDALNIRCSSLRYPMPDTPPFYDQVVIVPGDRMVIEPLPAFKGYVGSCCRTFQVGELSDEAFRSVECIERAQERAIEAIRPGVKTGEVVKAAHEVFEEMGYEASLEMVGHGIGLGGHEPPMLTAHGEEVLEEGMVLAVEIWKYDISGFAYSDSRQGQKNLGIFANEDLVVVTGRGADRLPYFRKDVLSLPHGG